MLWSNVEQQQTSANAIKRHQTAVKTAEHHRMTGKRGIAENPVQHPGNQLTPPYPYSPSQAVLGPVTCVSDPLLTVSAEGHNT